MVMGILSYMFRPIGLPLKETFVVFFILRLTTVIHINQAFVVFSVATLLQCVFVCFQSFAMWHASQHHLPTSSL